MALIRTLEEQPLQRPTRHAEIQATFSVSELDGAKLLQIDSYGSDARKIVGKKSQSMQFDEEGARQLFQILQRHFGFE